MIKLFFSDQKGFLRNEVLDNVGVLLNGVKKGKTQFYFNNDEIIVYYIPKDTQHDIIDFWFKDIVQIMKKYEPELLVYFPSHNFNTISRLVSMAKK